ncbi:MAG: hypothetical protein RLZZ444_3379 [Pseudomonadota bacterium]
MWTWCPLNGLKHEITDMSIHRNGRESNNTRAKGYAEVVPAMNDAPPEVLRSAVRSPLLGSSPPTAHMPRLTRHHTRQACRRAIASLTILAGTGAPRTEQGTCGLRHPEPLASGIAFRAAISASASAVFHVATATSMGHRRSHETCWVSFCRQDHARTKLRADRPTSAGVAPGR